MNLDMTDHCTTDFCIWRTLCLVPVDAYQVFVICIRRILHMTDHGVCHIQVHLYHTGLEIKIFFSREPNCIIKSHLQVLSIETVQFWAPCRNLRDPLENSREPPATRNFEPCLNKLKMVYKENLFLHLFKCSLSKKLYNYIETINLDEGSIV